MPYKRYEEGDLVGVNPSNWLYCSVSSQADEKLDLHVINGAWDFQLNLLTGESVYHTPTGLQKGSNWKIVYDVPFPHKFPVNDYNAAIDYMDAYIKKPVVVRWFDSTRGAMSKVWRRFTKACKAFKDAWQGKEMIAKDDYDSIPF